MKAQAAVFKFQPFSLKQKKVLTWWMEPSPYKDYDMIICDGSIRAGKTVAMIDGFITWSLATVEHESFILAGRSMGALKRCARFPKRANPFAKTSDCEAK